MNTRDHRPGHRPKVLAALLVLCVLVSAVASAPGWMHAQAPQRSIAAMPTPRIDPAVEPVAVLAMAEPTAPTTVFVASASGDSISHGSDSDVAAEYTLAASYESAANEQHEPVTADSTIEAENGYPIRLAAVRSSTLPGRARGTSGASGSAGSGSSGVAPGGNSSGPNQPAAPAAGGAPSDGAESAPVAPAQPAAGDSSSSEPPPSSIDDGARPDADPPSNGNPSMPDPAPPADEVVTTPPVDQTPIDLPPIEPPVQGPVSVPEPATLGLLLLGLAGIAGTRRRRATV